MRAQVFSDLWRWWTGTLPGRICSQVEASQSAGSGREQGRHFWQYLLLRHVSAGSTGLPSASIGVDDDALSCST